MSKIELEHAIRYATECTKIYLFQEYSKRFPQFFDYAEIKTRPAESKTDYYVPDSLIDSCLVVTETSFKEPACRQLACFPVRNDRLEACRGGTDEPLWVPLGSGHALACQPACFDPRFNYKMDTAWIANKCVEVNPFKKMFALNPEMLMDLRTHKNHGGLIWKDGKLFLTKEYCMSYGLDFDGRDCQESQGQSVGEFFIGKTLYRKIRNEIDNVQPLSRAPPVVDKTGDELRLAYFDNYLLDAGRTTNSVSIHTIQLDDDSNVLAETIVKELAVDYGMDLSADVVKHLLKKKIPKLVHKALTDVMVKSAVKQLVIRSASQVAIRLSTAAASALGGISHILFVVGMVSMVLDVIDPSDYDKVLDAARLERIDRKLDATYFGHAADIFRVVTPEYVWDHVLLEDDESNRYEYMSQKIREYVQALRTKPQNDTLPLVFPKPKKKLASKTPWLVLTLVTLLLVLMLIYDRWVHVWAVTILCVVSMTGPQKVM